MVDLDDAPVGSECDESRAQTVRQRRGDRLEIVGPALLDLVKLLELRLLFLERGDRVAERLDQIRSLVFLRCGFTQLACLFEHPLDRREDPRHVKQEQQNAASGGDDGNRHDEIEPAPQDRDRRCIEEILDCSAGDIPRHRFLQQSNVTRSHDAAT